MGGLGLLQGRYWFLAGSRHGGGGATVTIHGCSARVYALICLIAGLAITIPAFLLLFRVFFNVSTDLMGILYLLGVMLFVFSNVSGLIVHAGKSPT